MENYEIGIFLYYVLTGIFIYLCVLQIKNNDKNNNRN
jgi:hypothetical protein